MTSVRSSAIYTDKEPPADICVITTIHRPFDARIYDRGIRSLVRHGFTVDLIAPWPPEQSALPRRTVYVPMPRNLAERFVHGFRVFRAAMLTPAKTYHFHDIDFLLWSVLLQIVLRVPVIYDCHEDYPAEILHNKEWIPALVRRPLAELTRFVENAMVRRLGYCITVIPNLKARFNSLGVESVLVRNFTSRVPMRNLSHAPNVVYLGSISRAYGAEVLLAIGRLLRSANRPYRLLLTDSFQDEAVRLAFRQSVEHERLPIDILPRVVPSRIHELLGRACIGLSVEQDLPNMRQGYHAKLFDYMAHGLPIVASDIESNRHLVDTASCGILVTPDAGEEYMSAIDRLLEDNELFFTMQENGFRAVESVFSWENEQCQLIDFFRKLLGQTNKHGD